MLILSLDSSSAAGSAAVVRDGVVVAERVGDARGTHGERLPRELMGVLAEADVTLPDVDLFAVATGPGSFTGLRIGIATMQGLALASGKMVVPVSTFEAHGAAASGQRPTEALTAVWIDAHRGEVFAALYGPDGAVLRQPTSLSPAATLEAWSGALGNGPVVFAGDGAVRYRDAIAGALGATAEIPTAVPPLAGVIGVVAAAEPGRAVRPHAVVPLYVRRSDAELARDRHQGGREA